jgi:hypothetical protein
MPTESKERERHVNVVYGYLTSGNSVHDLITQLVQALWPNMDVEDSYRQFYLEIVEGLEQARKNDPAGFETTVQDELDYYEQIGIDNTYSAGSIING